MKTYPFLRPIGSLAVQLTTGTDHIMRSGFFSVSLRAAPGYSRHGSYSLSHTYLKGIKISDLFYSLPSVSYAVTDKKQDGGDDESDPRYEQCPRGIFHEIPVNIPQDPGGYRADQDQQDKPSVGRA